MEQMNVTYEGRPCYTISITRDFSELTNIFHNLNVFERRICIVTDSTVGNYYLDEVKDRLEAIAKQVITFTFPAGESSKKLDVIYQIYDRLIENKFDRGDILVALGGGVVGDMTGYAAATYLRGVRFVQIPTTLLSMVDSSIGGKTGVDFKGYKNMVGAFHQPSAVYINTSTLSTLTEEQFHSGMGEIIKHGLIRDKNYYLWLEEHVAEINAKDPYVISKMVKRSLEIKKNVVEKDPKELGERALLNFGHSLGHAIEKNMDFTMLHGDCVAVGTIAAAYISFRRGYISRDELEQVRNVIRLFSLPICIHQMDPEDILNATLSDKKMEAGKIRFILLESIGNAFIDSTVTKEEMREALDYIMC